MKRRFSAPPPKFSDVLICVVGGAMFSAGVLMPFLPWPPDQTFQFFFGLYLTIGVVYYLTRGAT